MSKEEITKYWIEYMIGREIIDYEIKPAYDEDGNVISYDIMMQPKESPPINSIISISPQLGQLTLRHHQVI